MSDLLLLKYDDIWLSQLTTIDERAFLLTYGKNYTTIFKSILKRNSEVRMLYNNFIDLEGDERWLNKLISNFSNKFPDKLKPSQKLKDEYLADVIQFLASAEA